MKEKELRTLIQKEIKLAIKENSFKSKLQEMKDAPISIYSDGLDTTIFLNDTIELTTGLRGVVIGIPTKANPKYNKEIIVSTQKGNISINPHSDIKCVIKSFKESFSIHEDIFSKYTIKVHVPGRGTPEELGVGGETTGFDMRDFEYEGTIKRSPKGWQLYDKDGSKSEPGPFNTLESLMDYYDFRESDLSGSDYIKNLKEKYAPYVGPAGPTKEQSEQNTKHLAVALKKLNIPFTEDRDYAKELWDGDDLLLKIINPKSKKAIYAGYDRWGYVIDGAGLTDEGIDQGSLKETLKYLRDMFKVVQEIIESEANSTGSITEDEVISEPNEVPNKDIFTALDKIRSAVKDFQKTGIVQSDEVLQSLDSKFTGMLGKLTGYVNSKYGEPKPAEEVPKEQPKSEEPKKDVSKLKQQKVDVVDEIPISKEDELETEETKPTSKVLSKLIRQEITKALRYKPKQDK